MEEQQPNLAPNVPRQPVQSPPPGPHLPAEVPPGGTKEGQQIPQWVIAAAAVVFGLLLLVGIAKLTQKSPVVAVPTPTPAATPTPTPIRTRSPFATTSAFMTLDAAVASYSAAAKGYNNTDPSLSPPVLDLNVGF